jgi:hypothetical protein
MDLFQPLTSAQQSCSETCPILGIVRDQLMAGNWGMAIRYLRQLGVCGIRLADCHPELKPLEKHLVEEERQRISDIWQNAFHGAVQVDFVCANQVKMQALQAAMQVSDIVPMSFNIRPVEDGHWDRMRVSIEI